MISDAAPRVLVHKTLSSPRDGARPLTTHGGNGRCCFIASMPEVKLFCGLSINIRWYAIGQQTPKIVTAHDHSILHRSKDDAKCGVLQDPLPKNQVVVSVNSWRDQPRIRQPIIAEHSAKAKANSCAPNLTTLSHLHHNPSHKIQSQNECSRRAI